MKINHLIKTTILTSATFLLLSAQALAAQEVSSVKASAADGNTTIFKTTATADADRFKISQILDFNFIEDKNYNKETLILKATGTINSGYIKPNPNDYNLSLIHI